MKKSLLLLFALIISATLFAQENTLDTPTSISARGVNKDAIEIVWDRVEGATGYNIYSGDELLTTIAATICTINGLEPETEYCFNISAVNETTESAKSDDVCAETFYVCGTPQNVKASAILNDPNYGKKYKITVKWDIVEGAELYGVYASSKFVTEPIWVGNASTNELVLGLDIDGEFYFSVKTICDSELVIVSDFSEEVGLLLSEDNIPDYNDILAPANLTATAESTSSIKLTWDAVENAMSYFVYCDDKEIANITETTYVVENLEYNTEYCYTVTAMGTSAESDPSEEACTKTLGESLIENNRSFEVYPNPVSDNITVSTNFEITEVNIYNILGVNVYNEQCTMNNLQLDINVSDFNEGVYFIKVKTENGETVKRFIKQ